MDPAVAGAQPPVAVPAPVWLGRRVLRYGPGLLLLGALGYLALLASRLLPGLPYPAVAVGLGMVTSNAFGLHPRLEKGIGTYELWLKTGIVLLGTQVALASLGQALLGALPLAVLCALTALGAVTGLARLFGLRTELARLLAVGTAVCGVTAILRTAPSLRAEEEDVEYSVAAVLLCGGLAFMLYPVAGRLLHLSPEVFGMWSGLSVSNTAEAAATGYIGGAAAGAAAVTAKLCRMLLLGPVMLLVIPRSAGPAPRLLDAWSLTPKFALGFVALSAVAATGFLSGEDVESLGHASSWLFLLAFTGLGLRLRWRDVRRGGTGPLLAAIGATAVVSATALAAAQVAYNLSS